MNPTDDLEKRIKNLRATTTDVVDQRILEEATAALENPSLTLLDSKRSSVWRNIMRSKWTKIAATLLVTATVGTVTLHRQMATVAYALEETLEANLGLRYLHIRVFKPGNGRSCETWAEFGEDGKMLRVRMNFPKTEDGEKEVVWQEGKAKVWFKTKGQILVLNNKEEAENISRELVAFDPKVIMEKLHKSQMDGKVEIETQKPSKEGDPITLLVSFNDSSDKQDIYKINPQTKLVEQFEKYRLVDDKRELLLRLEYLEYNQKISPEAFVLDIPADMPLSDLTTQEVGLSKGDLTDNQIAVKVAREFFEALIAEDYGKAGTIFSGTPASKMEEMFGEVKFLRIISVGDPTRHPNARKGQKGILQVPCEVEFSVEGENYTRKAMPNIRKVPGQSDRWMISGGI